MNNLYFIIIIMTFSGALGSIFLKKGSSSLKNIYSLIFNFNIFVGGILYVIAAILNIIVLRYLPYIIVLPLTSITYIWTMVLANLLLDEKINKNKIIGIIFIFTGSILISI